MSPFHQLDHTADICVEISGDSVDHLFVEAARALVELVAGPDVRGKREPEPREVHIEADDEADLLVAWLSEVLFWWDARGLFLQDFDDFSVAPAENSPWQLSASCRPFRPDPDSEFDLEIKAVTYHRLAVERTAGGWRARVVFDV